MREINKLVSKLTVMGDSIRDELRSLIQEVQVQNKAPVILVESRLEAQLQNLSHQLQELFGSLSASKGKDPKVGTSSNNQPNPNQEMCHRMDTCTDTKTRPAGGMVPRYVKLDFPRFGGTEVHSVVQMRQFCLNQRTPEEDKVGQG